MTAPQRAVAAAAPLGACATVPALAVEGLAKRYRKTVALGDVSFEVEAGSLVVLLGPAGAGKTTTLRLIAGLETPDAGRVLMRGEDVAGRQPKDRDLAMIFDNLALYPNKTGFHNIAHPLEVRGMPKAEIAAKVDAMAATLRIAHVLSRLPKTMSGGERQRVALGRALVRDPALFLLDEPLSSLDAQLRAELRTELRRLQREHGHTFLMATPDFAEAMAIGDVVVVLREGRVVQIDRAQTLYEAPADRFVARFVGAPEINLFPVRVASADGARLAFAGATAPAPGPLIARLAAAGLAAADASFEGGLRPEHLVLADPATAPVRGTLIDVEPLGVKAAFTVRNDAAELRTVVDAAAAVGLRPGETVGLDVALDHLLVFDAETGLRLG